MKLSTTSLGTRLTSIRRHLVSAYFNVFVVVSGHKTKLSKHLLWHSFFGNFYIIFYGTNAKIIN